MPKITSKQNKGTRTREKILEAARRVFARHPYHSASMRMIGKEAEVEHPLINYYFPNKGELFKAIIQDICDEFIRKVGTWLDQVKDMKIPEGFAKFIEMIIRYNQERPESLKILALNVSQSGSITSIPGYEFIPELIEKIRSLFEEKLPSHNKEREIRMYIDSLNFMIITFLGASACVASVQGMDPESEEYYSWIKSTLGYLYAPRLKEILLDRGTGS